MKYIFLGLMVLMCHYAFSQYRDINWTFGDSIGMTFSGDSIITFKSGITTYESCVTISDITGNLLFYTNGAKVWNKNHEIMMNGDYLNIGGVGWPLSTITQGVIIIPDPGNSDEYYIFQLDNPVYYSKVNIASFDGLGWVIVDQKNVVLYDINKLEKMTAVKHGNGRDWWLIIAAYPEGGSDAFGEPLLYYRFLITPYGIEGPDILEGILHENQDATILTGQMKFNYKGDMLSVTNGRSVILYYFNRCNGELIHYYTLDNIFTGSSGDNLYGLEISPDGSKLYTSKHGKKGAACIYQFNLQSADIINSKEIIQINNSGYIYGQLQLASNGKLYAVMPNFTDEDNLSNNSLSIIHSPNEEGLLCNYEHTGQYLGGGKVSIGLPNMPNYNLGPLEQSECDTLSTSITSINNNSSFTIAPNPVQEMFYIKTKQNTGGVFSLRIINIHGVEAMYLSQYIPGNIVSVSQLPEGMYAVLLTDEKGFLHQQKLIISR